MCKTIVRPAVAALLFLALCSSTTAQSSSSPEGQWILNLGTRTLLILTLAAPAAPGQSVSGSLSMAGFQTGDGRSFSHVVGKPKTEPIVASSGSVPILSITVQNPADPSDKDTFRFTLKDYTHAQLQFQGLPVPPFNLVRATGTPSIATDWDETKTYSPDDGAASNPEMKRIYDEDQRVRQSPFTIDWAVVNKSDAERREATRKLLAADALHTGEDFTWAAFVFQHGSTPSDFLMAHTLAMIAVGKGNAGALWIATATLDRYLQNMHQPQIYGTQFLNPPGQPTTQEPYDRSLIPDSLRRQLGVPIQSDQDQQRKQFDSQRPDLKSDRPSPR